jgi:competence protein ComEA
LPAPAGRPGIVARTASSIRASTWAPVIGRALAIASGMVALAAIGAASTLSGHGVPVADAAPVTSAGSVAAASASPSPVSSAFVPAASATPTSALPGSSSTAPAGAPSAGVTSDGKIVLNQATADELMKLPRVGPKRAQAILELRHRLGRFHQPTDLLRVKGIGRKTLRLMLPSLVLDAESAAKGAAQR